MLWVLMGLGPLVSLYVPSMWASVRTTCPSQCAMLVYEKRHLLVAVCHLTS